VAIRVRRALVGLATTAAVLALPAVASAAITPSLTLNQAAGTTAGSSPAIGFDAVFAPNPATDGVKDVTFALPPGLLANANINGGACLLAATPTAACQVGTGAVTAGGTAVPVTEYLVAAPTGSGAAGGVAVVNNATQQVVTTGVVSLGATGLNVAFTNLPAALDISEMNFTLTDLRLPTSCPSPAANVTVTADSQTDSTSKTATAPLNVTGCTGLPYAPTLAVSETKDAKDNGATLTFAITQAADEAASKTIGLKLPSGLGVNLSADVLCLTGSGPGCNVGTATATSPLVPNAALANGTVTLGGSASAPTITVAFPAPFAITLVGDVSLASGTVTINNVPDLPLTSLNLNLTGPNGQKAFTTSCTPSSTTGTFISQGNVQKVVTSTVTLNNCAAKPTASGSLSGLAAGHPKLHFKATHGKGAANIASVAVGLPKGLRFSRSAFVTKRTCVTKNGKRKCTTTTLIKGLGVSGASVKSVALKGGKLVLTLKKAAASVTVNLSGPVLTETTSLQTGVKKHKVKSLTVTLKVTDAKHTSTSVPLKLKAH
jgi:hypothetical protein